MRFPTALYAVSSQYFKPFASADTTFKPSAVLSDFSLDEEDRVSENATYHRCIRRDTGVVYALKRGENELRFYYSRAINS
jgi:hypothetical protein